VVDAIVALLVAVNVPVVSDWNRAEMEENSDVKKEVVVALVIVALVASMLVVLAFVPVIFVATRLVENRFVLVALVVVEFVETIPVATTFVDEAVVRVSEVPVAFVNERAARSESEVMFKVLAKIPPANVEVARVDVEIILPTIARPYRVEDAIVAEEVAESVPTVELADVFEDISNHDDVTEFQ
jgi:hypothetical protein